MYARDISANGTHWIPSYSDPHNAYEIGTCKAVLLSHGDRLQLSGRHTFTFKSHMLKQTSATRPQDLQIDAIQRMEREVGGPALRKPKVDQTNRLQSFNTLYSVSNRELGSGSNGQVFMAIDNWRRRQVACKIVALKKPARERSEGQETSLNASSHRRNREAKGAEFAAKLRREVDLLKDISHVSNAMLDPRNCQLIESSSLISSMLNELSIVRKICE